MENPSPANGIPGEKAAQRQDVPGWAYVGPSRFYSEHIERDRAVGIFSGRSTWEVGYVCWARVCVCVCVCVCACVRAHVCEHTHTLPVSVSGCLVETWAPSRDISSRRSLARTFCGVSLQRRPRALTVLIPRASFIVYKFKKGKDNR